MRIICDYYSISLSLGPFPSQGLSGTQEVYRNDKDGPDTTKFVLPSVVNSRKDDCPISFYYFHVGGGELEIKVDTSNQYSDTGENIRYVVPKDKTLDKKYNFKIIAKAKGTRYVWFAKNNGYNLKVGCQKEEL